MTAIQGWNGEDVQKAQGQAQEGREVPKALPIPFGRVLLHDGNKTTRLFVGTRFRLEHQLDLTHVEAQLGGCLVPALGNRRKAAVLNGGQGEEVGHVVLPVDAHSATVRNGKGNFTCHSLAFVLKGNGLARVRRNRIQKLVKIGHGMAVQPRNLIAQF